MNHKILQVLTVAFSVTLAGSYVYFAGRSKLRSAFEPHSIDAANTPAPDKRSPAGPTFTSDLDMIPGTKSFQLVPPDISGSNPTTESNPSTQPDKITDHAIIQALQKKSSFMVKQQSIREIAKTFSNQYKIPIIIDEARIRAKDILDDATITLELPSVSLRSALKLILEPRELTYIVENDVLLITARRSDMIMGTKSGLIDFADDIPMPPILKDLYQTPNPFSK